MKISLYSIFSWVDIQRFFFKSELLSGAEFRILVSSSELPVHAVLLNE